MTRTREHPDEFEPGELDAIRTLEVDYYGGGLKTPMAFLDRATDLAEQGLFKGKPSLNVLLNSPMRIWGLSSLEISKRIVMLG